ncbi:MAG: Lrp/AsnC ligand binding domain-containing protein [Chloroflexi bacterium]|nr:Lrp/AsnC ligand binding domain-containing protein [Chloroflexota bacterium]
MAEQAFILIETEAGQSRAVANALAKVQGVKRADVVTGPYDIIAHVEAPTLDAVGNLVTSKIQEVAGIIRTLTCLTVPMSLAAITKSQKK